MTDYQKYINALRKCAKEHENDRTFTGHIIVTSLCRDTANLLEALEQRSKIGYWILKKDKIGRTFGVCSECNHLQYAGELNYCPYCGMKMAELQKRNGEEV